MALPDNLRNRIFDFLTAAIVGIVFYRLGASTPFYRVPEANIADDLSGFRLVAWIVGLALSAVIAPILKVMKWRAWANITAIFVAFAIWFTAIILFNTQLEHYDVTPIKVVSLFCISVSSLAFLLGMVASTSLIFFWK